MVAGKMLEGIAQESDVFGMRLHHIHEGTHDGVFDGSQTPLATVVVQVVLGEFLRKKTLYTFHCALQEDESTDRKLQGLFYALQLYLILVGITESLMDEKGFLEGFHAIGIIRFEAFLKLFCCQMMGKK